MTRSFRARTGCLALIVLVVGGGWWLRDDIAGLWNRLQLTSSSRPSEGLAVHAVSELEAFARGDEATLQLSEAEIQSLLTYRAGPLLPPGVSDPLIEVGDSTVLLSARVDPARLEGLTSPDVVERLLSDSTTVLVELRPGVLQPGVAALEVVAVQAGSLVVPRVMVPWILGSLELEGVEVRGAALLIPLPSRVERFEVAGEELILAHVDPANATGR